MLCMGHNSSLAAVYTNMLCNDDLCKGNVKKLHDRIFLDSLLWPMSHFLKKYVKFCPDQLICERSLLRSNVHYNKMKPRHLPAFSLACSSSAMVDKTCPELSPNCPQLAQNFTLPIIHWQRQGRTTLPQTVTTS